MTALNDAKTRLTIIVLTMLVSLALFVLNAIVVADLYKSNLELRRARTMAGVYASIAVLIAIMLIVYMVGARELRWTMVGVILICVVVAVVGYIILGDTRNEQIKLAQGMAITAMIASLLVFLASCMAFYEPVNLISMGGAQAQISPVQEKERQKRLDNGPTEALFHQTGVPSADSILQSQEMRPGAQGALGGGIYFTDTPSNTARKTTSNGPILQAEVHTGKQIIANNLDSKLNFQTVLNMGADSVRYNKFASGPEVIVYSSDQVSNIRNTHETCKIAPGHQVKCHVV